MYNPIFIVLYFGKLPNTFCYWLEGCKNNPKYTWLLITDDKSDYIYPNNVIVNYMDMVELKNLFNSKLEFEVNFTRPYKLCDFRPLFGDLFYEKIKDYTHWGWCDTDMLFGRIDHFVTDEMLSFYSKIHVMGHMTIIKNGEEERTLYKKCNYKKILTNDKVCTFDELYYEPNINSLMKNNSLPLKEVLPYADIGDMNYNFITYEYKGTKMTSRSAYPPSVFYISKNGTYQLWMNDNEICSREVMYVHFQKRKINCDINVSGTEYYLLPNRIEEVKKNTDIAYIIKTNSQDNVIYHIEKFYAKIINKLRNFIQHLND